MNISGPLAPSTGFTMTRPVRRTNSMTSWRDCETRVRGTRKPSSRATASWYSLSAARSVASGDDTHRPVKEAASMPPSAPRQSLLTSRRSWSFAASAEFCWFALILRHHSTGTSSSGTAIPSEVRTVAGESRCELQLRLGRPLIRSHSTTWNGV
ncbi:hypothetical protein OG413_05990 [Streptomyces sp. NBC_01433]|uniref:hypothetical protein n=1 Tax=Streptomyces sp. NBC_01433 TaxID=2903864 RepID=UPI00225ACC45|nr:hypothetical protein [Streptomyces sp. NBC_01433]MCX4674880.1 hypothetical protein [Streptomyces sp. NBC_01433]